MKLTITFETGERQGTSVSFSGKQFIRLGRHPDNEVVFNEEENRVVSGFHAEIRILEGRVFIADLDSTNGMLINDQWAQESIVSSGDIVELGKRGPSFRVRYEADASDPPIDPTIAPEDWLTAPTQEVAAVPNQDGHQVPATARIRFRSYPVSRETTSHPPHTKSDEPDAKYGKRTVGMMIQNALEQAGIKRGEGTTKSTDYIKALVDQKVGKSSSRLKKIIVAIVAVLIVLGGLFAYFLYRSRSVQVYQTTQVNYGDESGGSIAAANRYAIFMLAGQQTGPNGQPGPLTGFCTAFAVARDILATNAHCTLLATKDFTNVSALMNGAPANRYSITHAIAHPGYQPGKISPDVGLVRIRGQLANLVTIGGSNELSLLSPGVSMFLYGFPGRLNKEEAPEATFIKGGIGRVTTFDQKLGNFGQNTLLQHSAFSTGGTSGSPIFNTSGRVVGINAGGYTEDGKPLSGYNFAMRIDLINTLLPLLGRN
ncbi:MAG: FHA domain-containing protein [Deltaproteobacteria bacterium]|nr:FHA domain-containing protein [Deltaproteobacteria bacterium]